MSQPDNPKVSIIIPVLHWKRPLNKKRFFMPRQTIEETLRDIKKNVQLSYEVIVVCNGQDPELLDFIQANHEQAIRDGFAEELNKREQTKLQEQQKLKREYQLRQPYYDPYWGYPYPYYGPRFRYQFGF